VAIVRLTRRLKVAARMSASLTRSLEKKRYAALVLAQSWHTSGILSAHGAPDLRYQFAEPLLQALVASCSLRARITMRRLSSSIGTAPCESCQTRNHGRFLRSMVCALPQARSTKCGYESRRRTSRRVTTYRLTRPKERRGRTAIESSLARAELAERPRPNPKSPLQPGPSLRHP